MDVATREKCLYVAKLAEQAERYDEMVKEMAKIAVETNASTEELSVEERNLLSVAYKNMIGGLRSSWRVVNSYEQKSINKGYEKDAAVDRSYRERIEAELSKTCEGILTILDENLVPSAKSAESKVFFYKMYVVEATLKKLTNREKKGSSVDWNREELAWTGPLTGDYFRYLAEFSKDEPRTEFGQKAAEAYQSAAEVAESDLPSTHPIRLGLALNFSVFNYEILNAPASACQIAKKAFNDAMSMLEESSTDETYKDSTLIMQLLRDNLSLWRSDLAAEDS